MFPLLLAQATQSAPGTPAPFPPAGPTWIPGIDTLFWLTLLFIFLTGIVSAIVRLRVRDKCLRLLDDYHVSYLTLAGRTLWGDVLVFSQGLELRFDAPFHTERGLVKSSAMIYQPELAQCLALCRWEDALTEPERRARREQVRRSFNPNVFRRTFRAIRNVFNTIRDAFSKSFSAFVGHLTRMHPTAVLAAQSGNVDQLGQTIISALPNAYEPMLERHIGKPVVLELVTADPVKTVVELPGYLVDYSDRFVAVFNVDHTPIETLELEVAQTTERLGMKIELTDTRATITCLGPDALVVKRAQSGDRTYDLAATLLHGAFVQVPRTPGQPVKLTLVRTRRLDLVCPRLLANVRFGGEELEHRGDWLGLAPDFESEHLVSIRDALRQVLRPLKPGK